ncbi:conjugative transposon protein TraM [Mucilaginibacter robiniae]|uniref:Conjugative transposon protein TraM n=1 Tax=Mucilaginibacter robiniae TaxID=2728022 RepID=A0A7L5E5H5_9SPHI|nr:conjugative transposon protein TraM [Mucilaginibacter robiniae]QJD96103.1 conjugative transposon protein TraM [Mucilaginibacter robiniae]
MKPQNLTPKMDRQRKMLLAMPLMVLPFVTLFFWALGGGKASPIEDQQATARGFNSQLPEARLKSDTNLDKMSYYDQAARDSDKLRQQMKSDPYYHQRADTDTARLHFPQPQASMLASRMTGTSRIEKPNSTSDPATNEAKVYARLAALHKAIHPPVVVPAALEKSNPSAPVTSEAAAPAIQVQTPAEDPELKQMNRLMEKILDIQHPERLDSQRRQPAVSVGRFRAIPAIIDGNQKITQGSVVRLKLMDTVTLNGQLLPKGQLIYGSGSLYNQRLTMTLKMVRIGYTILPVDLTVYDMTDGLEGIRVPEAITGDAVRDGASSGVQGVQFMSLDPSLTTQLAGAGLTTAKGLFSKKIKRIKAKLQDKHPLLLRNNVLVNQSINDKRVNHE